MSFRSIGVQISFRYENEYICWIFNLYISNGNGRQIHDLILGFITIVIAHMMEEWTVLSLLLLQWCCWNVPQSSLLYFMVWYLARWIHIHNSASDFAGCVCLHMCAYRFIKFHFINASSTHSLIVCYLFHLHFVICYTFASICFPDDCKKIIRNCGIRNSAHNYNQAICQKVMRARH